MHKDDEAFFVPQSGGVPPLSSLASASPAPALRP